jgi:hypothetical protein
MKGWERRCRVEDRASCLVPGADDLPAPGFIGRKDEQREEGNMLCEDASVGARSTVVLMAAPAARRWPCAAYKRIQPSYSVLEHVWHRNVLAGLVGAVRIHVPSPPGAHRCASLLSLTSRC